MTAKDRRDSWLVVVGATYNVTITHTGEYATVTDESGMVLLHLYDKTARVSIIQTWSDGSGYSAVLMDAISRMAELQKCYEELVSGPLE